VAGGALVLTGVYHVALVLAAVLVLREAAPLRMIPSPRDFRDAVRTFAYFVRLRKEPPEGRSRRYFQKVDYWFMAWSLAVMAVTGLLNLLPLRAARLLSADTVLASLRTHGDAAPLVVAWVVVVHLLYSGLTPPLFEVKAIASRTAPPAARLRDAAATAAGGGASGAAGVAPVTPHHPGRPRGEDWEGPA
jgi:thiosulfate reductase cytochrome b subunit